MNSKNILRNILICLTLASSTCIATAQDRVSVRPIRGYFPTYEWTRDTWKGDDHPYTFLRIAVDNVLSRSKSPLAVAQRFEREAQQKPLDPKAQFKRAYAAFRANRIINARVPSTPSEYQHLLDRASEALGQVPEPHTYEFYRLRFLIETAKFPSQSPELKEAGRRLTRANKKDLLARQGLFNIASAYPNSREDFQEVLQLAQEIKQLRPNTPSSYSALGRAYETMYAHTRNASDVDKAIANYQIYLRLAPPNDPFRHYAVNIISYLQKQRRKK